MTLRAMMLYGTVVIDAWLVAGLGEEALAAMGVAAAIGGLLLGILLAFSNATQILVAQSYGTGRAETLKTALICGLWINLGAAVLGLICVGIFAGPVIDSSAHTPWIASEARHYLIAFSVVVLAEAVAQSVSAHLNGCGETRQPFYSYVVAVPVNIIVSVIFIYGYAGMPEMGVTGAAIGSAVSAIVRAGYLVRYIKRSTDFRLEGTGWTRRTIWQPLRRHLAFSLPVAATFISATFSNSVCTLIYARMDVNDFAAMTLINPWVQVAGTVGMSWAQATGIMVAQHLGRGVRDEGLDDFMRQAWIGAIAAAGAVALFYFGICAASSYIYDDLQPQTRAALWSFLPILLILPFPKGSNAICGNTLRAAGETVYVMHIFVWSQWLFRVPATAIMVLWLDLPVAWVFALALGEELVKFPSFHLRIRKGKWKQGSIPQ
ncbi:MATE family efflux transporter [Falsirhodobacter sp. alg1]|uniref:MATE family efflux transporter n=1 Tax=Falsirhodobacter sp. alg1 TaxID=1472418 RepID=UPI0005EEB38F|nr:MATE family efflux transporter [Falsirhodobacter sp. alg1]